MNILHTPLFASSTQKALGVGFHNIGGKGVLRASDTATVNRVQFHYGERCGHVPLEAHNIRVLVDFSTNDIRMQMEYLSQLFGKDIVPITAEDFREEKKTTPEQIPLVVPYINVPETEVYLRDELGAETWGIPAQMTSILKNKADFYQLVDELGMDGFCLPDYKISSIYDVAKEAYTFLAWIEDVYKKVELAHIYPLGVMLRAAESDGNYGCCLVYENEAGIVVVQDGNAERAQSYSQWHEALAMSQQHLAATMNLQKETRIVISRYVDLLDSPGMSVVILNGQVESLRWNGQVQKKGSRACVGTSTYAPTRACLRRMQQQYEDQTAASFELFLRRTASKYGIDFACIRGVANVDILLPGELEERLQRQRKQPAMNYLAECNPRWTNYTDAIMTMLGVSRREQTISNMRAVIREGILAIDKYPLPGNVDPRNMREAVFEKDEILKQDGTRIICRMAKNPMGFIFAGNIQQAQQEVAALSTKLSTIQ
ncbi:MAG: hypothetical protein JO202_19025 [Ktedonobacteraceae bacterium]|nr:hypothetical protein [Ktedonobacteraceae bacterium]